MKNLLITGSGGFIGGNLKKYFTGKYTILSPRSYELDCIDSNAVQNYFKEHQIDYIIHCGTVGGARGVQDKDTTIEDNLKMVENILEYKNDATKVILFGSGAMYDKSQSICKAKEDDIGKILPYDLYGQSKMLISQNVKDRNDVVCLNIFGCYGYNELPTRFPTYAIEQNIKHLPIIINRNVVFDYLFIEDLSRIIEHFLTNSPEKNIINVTPTNSIQLYEIAQIVNEISDFKSEITIKNPVLGNEYTGDNSRLLKEIPNFQFTDIKSGLKKLYNYIKQEH